MGKSIGAEPRTMDQIIRTLTGSIKERTQALDSLVHYFKSDRGSHNPLDDKSYHAVFEALFRCTLSEKENYFAAKKGPKAASSSRLVKCAEALRLIVSHGASRIKRKTVRAIIDHITEVLPGAEEDYFEPLLNDYLKAFACLLEVPSVVENLVVSQGDGWVNCADFCIEALARYLGSDVGSASSARGSPAPGTGQASSHNISSGRSASTTWKRADGQLGSSMVADLASCLNSLVAVPNAPVQSRAKEISRVLVQILQTRQNIAGFPKVAFSAINHVFEHVQVNDISLAKSLARDLIPLVAYWWSGRASSRDAMLNSIREEMLKAMYGIHLHIDNSTRKGPDTSLLRDLEDLLDTLWSEYSRRDERSRLQLDDLTFTSMKLPSDHPRAGAICFRPFNVSAEPNWALLEILALFETIHSRNSQPDRSQSLQDDDQPRKRRRILADGDRLHKKLNSIDRGLRLTAMQLVSFTLKHRQSPLSDISTLIEDLTPHLMSKEGTVASWAMLACASLAAQEASHHPSLLSSWKEMWSHAGRSVSSPGTSRAASVLLRTILKSKLVQAHEIADDVNQMITSAGVSGPSVLVDSSLSLMLELLRVRNMMLPNASQLTYSHIIRWVFLKWNPSDLTYASLHSKHAASFDLVNLLRTCCGLPPLSADRPIRLFEGPIAHFWQQQAKVRPMVRYLLLLDDDLQETSRSVEASSEEAGPEPISDPFGSHAAKRLILELFHPKVDELLQMSEGWQKRSGEGSVSVTLERLQSVFAALILAALLLPELSNLNTASSKDFETAMFNLCDNALKTAFVSGQGDEYPELLLMSSAPYVPALSESSLAEMKKERESLLRLLAKFSAVLQEKILRESARQHPDSMDVDEDDDDGFGTQSSQRSAITKPSSLSRRDIYLSQTSEAFYQEMEILLQFLQVIHEDEGQIGNVPESIVDRLCELSKEKLLCCRSLMRELFSSNMNTTSEDAMKMIEAVGSIINGPEFHSSEVALCACIDVLEGLISLWTDEAVEISSLAGDLYHHFIKTTLPKKLLSANAQIWLARLLFRLLEAKPTYAERLHLPSCRTSLLSILQTGSIEVKYFIGVHLPRIFGLYVLKTHDDIFVDILEVLPSDQRSTEGIAFRLFVMAELACNWSSLLRRAIYHIFETPGKITRSLKYATVCLRKIARSLKLDSSKELFQLFAPQLLYTWLDTESIQNIPYEIFGFGHLNELLLQAQTEATGIMIMMGQDQAVLGLATVLGSKLSEMILSGFSKIASYSFAYDISTASKTGGSALGETRLKKLLGKEPFLENMNINFAEIVANFFTFFDQEDDMEKYLGNDVKFRYAADNLQKMKEFCHLNTVLPPNQQPEFKGKYLQKEIEFLCGKTPHDLERLWTPALVVCVARKLLNTIHPVLGPLHACSVLRKIRVLISLAGPQALSGYPLEMLLHSIRSFIVNTECADDALGVSQYLLEKGREHLTRNPSYLAGYALSTLADLRVFLESSQASTTQESQFKATMTKAQLFHSWFSRYLAEYDSPDFKDDAQRTAFKSITASAAKIRTSGNAEKGSSESSLLLEILKDWENENQLLNEPARDVALSMLCGTFEVPIASRRDVMESDEASVLHGAVVWKSCRSEKLSKKYLAWAGRVVGRSFAASGEISQELLRESRLEEYRKISSDNMGSEEGLLKLIETLTVSSDYRTAGLAESALRVIVSQALADQDQDQDLVSACQKSLTSSLLSGSDWGPYITPPSDMADSSMTPSEQDLFQAESLENPNWVQQMAVYMAKSEPDIIISVLPPLLSQVKGFAEQAFPFIVHLVLYYQMGKNQGVKRQMSEASKEWLKSTSPAAKDSLKLFINTILYLRTQPVPNEASIADRDHWLDIDFSSAAGTASGCGLHKIALLFAELANSEMTRTSRRSSMNREVEDASEVLLEIFENIDDPDAYYGLDQDASLATVLSRLEYENDGAKSLAFRGAQYNSHLRRRDVASTQDGYALVKALSSLGLSGLSHSLLQAQQGSDTSTALLDSTFTTARRLEVWNLPAPHKNDSHAVTLYKAYQSVQKSADVAAVRTAIYDGLSSSIRQITHGNLNASTLRQHLGALAALTELDDLINVADNQELKSVLGRFESRAKWMMSGRYGDVSHILSCRETSLSLITQHPDLRPSTLTPGDHRLAQIRGMLLSSDIYRFHRATQETLNLSTALTDLIEPSEAEGLSVDAAIRMEAANSLWDHGEMISSIHMLKKIDQVSILKKQSVPVSRADLLSKIGYQVSVARLEGPDSIQKQYLEPALKEIKGKMAGKEAGEVFHQFATFCDQQLQNPDSLEDLARLQNLKKGKNAEVEDLKALLSSARDSQHKQKYSSHLSKAKQWLELDQLELRRVEQTRNEFVRLSIENYLLCLMASDEHSNDALRFTALWLERSDDDTVNEAVSKYLPRVPSRKFATLMNQLSSRLQNQNSWFYKLLFQLIERICVEHPYHSMYQIWTGARARTSTEDQVAQSRRKAADQVIGRFSKNEKVSKIWQAIDNTNRAFHTLAMDRDPSRYKSGQKIPIKDVTAGKTFLKELGRYPIPPPTMQIDLSATKDYSTVPVIVKFETNMTIASGVSAPKIITAVGSDGKRYKQLVKGGTDDLRQDAIMEQVFAEVSELLKLHRTTRQRNLGIRTYKVLPLTQLSGVIEFVQDTQPLHDYLMPAHEQYYPKDLKGSQCRKEISNVQSKTADQRISTFRKVTDRFHPVMRYFFMEHFPDPDEWFIRRTAYTRTTAAISMLGHVMGLGDRHGHNILMDKKTGEVVHIDLGVAFEMGRVLPVPELVPFRLTRDIVDGMGITKTEGVFRRCCEFTLDALREETYSIMTILDVLRYDPLYSWSMSPVRMSRLQTARATADDAEVQSEVDRGRNNNRGGAGANEPSEAHRALEVVRKKLSKTLSVTATVNDLINQATDERNLAMLYSGWAAYA